MVMWPAVSLLGFVVLTALVVLMGMQSTKRYEAEKRAASVVRPAPESAARATAAATAVL